jgi:hypothetical protein
MCIRCKALQWLPFLHHILVSADPPKEPIAASYSAPGVLAEAAHQTGRAKADFELREISREEYEKIKSLLHL